MKNKFFILFCFCFHVMLPSQAQTWTHAGNSYVSRSIESLKTYNNILYVGGNFKGVDTTQGNCSFSAQWDGTSLLPYYNTNVSGSVFSCFEIHNSTLYVGGGFTITPNAAEVAKWDGTDWVDLTGLYKLNSNVYAMKSFGGNLYVGGNFTTYNSVNYNHIAMHNGTSYSTVGSGFDGSVNAFTIYNSELYAGGGFFNSGSTPIDHIAKWDGTTWQPIGSGINGGVLGMAVLGNDLYAVGLFTLAGSANVNNIAKWDGASWTDVGGGLTGGSGARTILSYNNAIYVGGEFTTAGSVSAKNVAMWDGTSWSALSSGLPNIVNALEIYNGDLYAGLYANPFVTDTNYVWKYAIAGSVNELGGDPGFTMDAHYNSASSTIIVNVENTGNIHSALCCNIYNLSGQNILTSGITKGKNELDINEISNGIYFCEVISEKGKRICKVVVLKS